VLAAFRISDQAAAVAVPQVVIAHLQAVAAHRLGRNNVAPFRTPKLSKCPDICRSSPA
jgi:hypothetical protein